MLFKIIKYLFKIFGLMSEDVETCSSNQVTFTGSTESWKEIANRQRHTISVRDVYRETESKI